MPHSSGGGFGGGGGHSGGFHSSGGSGGSHGPRFSTRPFSGARKYSYINRYGAVCVFYSVSRPTQKQKPIASIVPLIFALIIVLIVGAVVIANFIPSKLSSRKCNFTGEFYADNAGIVTDVDALNESFDSFYEKTGVQPYLYTLNSSAFPSQYGDINKYSLEDYAYDLYLDLFNDEGHWLIVFVKYDSSPYYGWIDMAGDDTDSIITSSFFNKFQQSMQTNLNAQAKSSFNYEKAIIISMDNATQNALNYNVTDFIPLIFISIFMLVFVGGIIAAIVQTVKHSLMINGYIDYVEKNPNAVDDQGIRIEKESEKATIHEDVHGEDNQDPFS